MKILNMKLNQWFLFIPMRWRPGIGMWLKFMKPCGRFFLLKKVIKKNYCLFPPHGGQVILTMSQRAIQLLNIYWKKPNWLLMLYKQKSMISFLFRNMPNKCFWNCKKGFSSALLILFGWIIWWPLIICVRESDSKAMANAIP